MVRSRGRPDARSLLHGRRPAVAPDRPLDRGHPGVSARRELLDAGLRRPGAADRHRERRGAAASAGAAPDARGGLPDLRRGDAVRGGRARSRRGGRGRGGSHDVHELRHRDADDLRRREPDRFHGQDAGRRQAAAHRREPVHDRVREPGRRQAARGVRLALSGQDPAGAAGRTGRPARRPEGRVPLRGQGRLDRHRVPAQDRDGALRRRGLHHAVARGRRAGLPPRRRHGREARAGRRREPARGHRLSGRARPLGQLRHPVRGRHQVGHLRREGFFFASLTGPGWVWLQSLPFSRLAGRIHQAAPQTGGGGKGEGSLLGRLSGVGWDGS